MIYAAAIPVSFFEPGLALLSYVVVAAIWFIPDRRLESRVEQEQ